MSLIKEVKKKRELSGLPDSIVQRAVQKSGGEVKGARALLRKYFGVFLTNKVLKAKGDEKEMLENHMSSKKRNYEEFYKEIFSPRDDSGGPKDIKGIHSVIDLGCGANGFSYGKIKEELGSVDYVGIEAAGQLVDGMNKYFEEKMFLARAECMDLFEFEKIVDVLKRQNKDRCVFLFQVVDALENLERDFSKKFITEISKECEWIVVSLPTESLGGRKKFTVQRKWIVDYLEENFSVKKDFKKDGERILVVKVKK
ncbi:hypothetical protein KAS08_03590 [Candidatus Pacearchaeota archaeon]|nr:hypothetical protein [Candidatus Pacearchaeota archaeon]